ncbi:MAG: hypothetical protein LBR81_05970 [Prevotellaceae bacterium]|jgi:hypothetical protein|nr:hypothetical protein [Prevotellaceae bacterium]
MDNNFQYLDEVKDLPIEQKTSAPKLVLSAICIIAAFVLFFCLKHNVLYNILGIILLVIGVFLFIKRRSQRQYRATGSNITQQSFFFEMSDFQRVNRMLDKPLADEPPLHFLANGGVRMDVIASDDKQFAAVQLLTFVPFQHEPATPVYSFTGEQASIIISFIENSKSIK